MSDTTPTIEVPEPPQPAGSSSGGSGRRKAVAGGAGVVVLAAVVGGGAYAYNQLSGGGPQPEDVLPATTQVYARLDLDPGASQKIELFKLLNKVPEVGEALGIKDPNKSDVRKLVFNEITENACPDIDYEKDVEPWLGDRVGVGANLKEGQFVIAVQVKDEKKAEDGIDGIFQCADEDYGIAFYEGYALVSDSQKSVDDALDDAKKKPLSDSKEFRDDMSALGEKGIASAWFDASAFADLFAGMPGFAEELTDEDRKLLDEAGTVATALRVDGNAIELAGIGDASDDLDDFKPVPVGQLPADTVAALSFSGVGQQIAGEWDTFLKQLDSQVGALSGPAGPPEEFLDTLSEEERAYYEELYGDSSADIPDPETFIKQFEAETGLSLPQDLESLLGSTFTLAIGSNNLEALPQFRGPDDLEKLDIAIRTVDGENGKALDVMTKLADYASKNGIPLVAEKSDDGAVLATSGDAARRFSQSGKLGDSDRFKAVMPYGDDTMFAFYADVSTIVDKLLKADPPRDVRRQIKEFGVVEAIGMSGAVDGDRAKFSLRVNFTD